MFIIIDTETTGFDPFSNALISVGMVLKPDLRDDYIATKMEFKMNAGTYAIEPSALKHNKLTVEEIALWPDRKKTTETMVKAIESWGLACNKMIPVGHNYLFDRQFLLQVFSKDFYEGYFDYHYQDTMNVANFLNLIKPGFSRGVSLQALRDKYKITHEGAHTALADALATAEVMKGLLNDVEIRNS